MATFDLQSPLLRLPREIRDMIYSYVLVSGTIALEGAVTRAPRSRITVGGEVGFCEALYQKYKLTYPLTSRSTWTIPLEDLAIPEASFQLDSSAVHITYQIRPSMHGRRGDSTSTSLLQVCKQIYSEAVEIFYSKNNFSFTGEYRIPTAVIFLRDRPAVSLHLIRSLELPISYVEDHPPSGVAPGRYSGRHVLHRDYGFYAELCGLLSSPKMDLRKLSLTVETDWVNPLLDADGPALRRQENFKWLYSKKNRTPEIVEWVHPLLKINTLEKLSVYWINGLHTRIIGQTIALMAQSMLKIRSSLETNQTRPGQERIELLYRTVHRNHPPSCAVVVFDPSDQSVSGRSCAIYDDGERLIEVEGDDYNFDPRLERPVVQEYLDTCPVCLTCYCEVNVA
ncbi:hypothetical protein P171DRAFT_490260 [Karstenula rhodostoma CBS 690.94]|uniref:DUF7730 domain-containing protein n=1 Tax=Karstenula rhodostoma CBS 690.94 TaxID=1392251 RepID=A0A9P4U7W4_9PLEO|nr:hypothetical protein P171DRAFT_490260 [Karstenula rhodostoma CBS 690.94]